MGNGFNLKGLWHCFEDHTVTKHDGYWVGKPCIDNGYDFIVMANPENLCVVGGCGDMILDLRGSLEDQARWIIETSKNHKVFMEHVINPKREYNEQATKELIVKEAQKEIAGNWHDIKDGIWCHTDLYREKYELTDVEYAEVVEHFLVNSELLPYEAIRDFNTQPVYNIDYNSYTSRVLALMVWAEAILADERMRILEAV